MTSTPEIIDAARIPFTPSKTGAKGCWGKMIFNYGEGRLGDKGHADPYTTIYRFDKGAFYPPIRVLIAPMELYVLSGVLTVGDVSVQPGHWARVSEGGDPMVVGSLDGAEIIAIVRGRVEIAN